jgi:hypothetical protein
MLLLVSLAACTKGEDSDSLDWLIEARDAGEPMASGTGFDVSDPTVTFFAAQHVVPGLYYGQSPPSEIPLLLWDHLLGANISDEGICPALQADGAKLIYTTNCRSAEGYNFTGTVEEVSWEEEGQRWQQWSFDLEVDSDIEDASFRRIALQGEIWYASANEDLGLLGHTQANVLVEAEDYWAQKLHGDNLELAWSELALTGIWETQEDPDGELHVFSGMADLGEFGGYEFRTEGLLDQPSQCVGEPKGTLELGEARLRFEGPARCDKCAEATVDGDTTLACPSLDYLE